MTRILILLALVFGGAVVGLLIWINSRAEDRDSVKKELLETGRVKVQRPPREGPVGARSGGLAREILRVDLPTGDRRQDLGGPCVLSLRASNTYFRRRALGEAAYLRGALSRADADALLARAAACGTSGPPGADEFRITVSAEGPRVQRAATAEAILALQETLGRHERPYAPEALRLGLAVVPAAPEGVEPQPWPLRHQDPAALVPAPLEVKVTRSAAERLAEAARDQVIFQHGDPARLYRVSSVEVVLP